VESQLNINGEKPTDNVTVIMNKTDNTEIAAVHLKAEYESRGPVPVTNESKIDIQQAASQLEVR